MKLQHLRDGRGDAIIHKAGCAHIARLAQWNRDGDWIFEAETKRQAAIEIWSDHIYSDESMTEDDAVTYTQFAPCVTIK
jgi:hypothetical protein